MVNLPFDFAFNYWPTITAILVFIALALYSFKNRGVPGALPFMYACLFGMLWSLGLILEYAAVDLEAKIFWHKFMVMWQLPTTTAITCFILEYAQPGRWLTRRNLVLLSIVPVLAMVLSITNDSHHLFWEGFLFNRVLIPIQTPLLRVIIVYGYLLGVINIVIFVWLFIRSPQNRWPVVIMTFGQIAVRFLMSLEFIFQIRIGMPLSSIGLALISFVYAIVIFRYKILGPIPLAREAVVEQIPVGMLVLDDQERVNSINPAAERMLNLSSRMVKGRPIWDVITAYPREKLEADEEFAFSFASGGNLRNYRLEILILRDWRGLTVGKLCLLTDVTEQRKAQAKILEQQRVVATLQERDLLARELHDDLAQVLAFIDTQGQTIQRLINRGDYATVGPYLERLITAASEGEMNLRKSILGMRLTLSPLGLLETLKRFLAQVDQNYGLHTEIILEDSFDHQPLDPMVEVQLLRILQEALNNIRKHAQVDRAAIRFGLQDHKMCITIQDDGRGFVLAEDGLDTTGHFGLQMMRERAEAVGGTINWTSQPGRGTEIRVCVSVDRKKEPE